MRNASTGAPDADTIDSATAANRVARAYLLEALVTVAIGVVLGIAATILVIAPSLPRACA